MSYSPRDHQALLILRERLLRDIQEGLASHFLLPPFDTLVDGNHEYLGDGKSRAVFLWEPGWVVKVPIRDEGIYDNMYEARLYREWGKTKDIVPYAECRQVALAGLEVLLMEYVERDTRPRSEQPSWVDWVDCRQVGFDKEGNLVAYDYG